MHPRALRRLVLCVGVLLGPFYANGAELPQRFVAKARFAYWQAQKAYTNSPANEELAFKFAQACADFGEIADNNTERAEIAEQGIAACKKVLEHDRDSVAAHYYLGMNLGELARTRGIGALKLVTQMETQFKIAAEREPKFDYGGPYRNLGLLYRDAPYLGSIGSRTRAHKYLQLAVDVAPNYPENRLNLLESFLKWNDRNGQKRELTALEQLWPKAQKEFSGPKWEATWFDWNQRLAQVKKKMGEPSRVIESPRGRET